MVKALRASVEEKASGSLEINEALVCGGVHSLYYFLLLLLILHLGLKKVLGEETLNVKLAMNNNAQGVVPGYQPLRQNGPRSNTAGKHAAQQQLTGGQ